MTRLLVLVALIAIGCAPSDNIIANPAKDAGGGYGGASSVGGGSGGGHCILSDQKEGPACVDAGP